MSSTEITVYGAHWCPDCRTSKQFLGEHQIPYNWVDIEEDPANEKFAIEKNEGKRIIPTIVFAAGDVRDTRTKQVVSAAGEGSTAALLIREYLKSV